MTRPTSRGEPDLRALLIGAALEILEESDTPLDLRKVAERAGKSRTAPYLVFGKEREGGGLVALRLAVATEGARLLLEELTPASLPGEAPLEAFHRLAHTFFRFATRHERLFRLMFGPEIGVAPALRTVPLAEHSEFQGLVEARTELEESLRRVIERCQEARLLPEGDSLRATMIAWASLQGIALLLLDEVLELAGIETTADEAADLATEALVGAPPSVITGAALCLIEAQRQKIQAIERAEVSERLSPLASADVGMWRLGPDSPPHEPEPFAPEAGALQPALRRAMAARAAVRGARILWIDDHPEWIEWETEMLDRLEMDVTTTSDTGSALELLAAEPFDLILSDIARGSRDDEGVAALPALRAVAPDTPVIFYVGRLHQQRGRPAGSDGITDRPDELLHLVLDVLERRRI